MKNEEKTHAMLCHLLSFTAYVGIPFGNVLGPLIMWLVSKDKSAFVDRHGKAAVNFQLRFSHAADKNSFSAARLIPV